MPDFQVFQEEAEWIRTFLQAKGTPVRILEIAEEFVARFYQSKYRVRIYSPEQSYHIGERIALLLSEAEVRLGSVYDVGRTEEFYLDEVQVRRKTIKIHFDDGEMGNYVSCCPEFPARFRYEFQEGNEFIESGYITPGQIASRKPEFRHDLVKSLERDSRFVSFEDLWSLREMLAFRLEQANEIRENLIAFIRSKQSKVSSIKDLIETAAHTLKEDAKYELREFSLNFLLVQVKELSHVSRNSEMFWMIISAPFARITLTQEQIQDGVIPVTDNLNNILFYFGLSGDGAQITFKVPNNANLVGKNERNETITSSEIRSWFIQTDLKEGDRLYVRISEEGELRLFPEFSAPPEFNPPPERPDRPDRHLREEIYKIIFSSDEFLHYKEIHKRLGELFDEEISLGGVGAVLSINSHLFVKHNIAAGLWGLKSWDPGKDIDRDSLLHIIEDGDLAYEILNRRKRAMSYHEIAKEISSYLGVRIVTIEETVIFVETYLEEKQIFELDQRFLRDIDGRWILREWQHGRELEIISQKLATLKEEISNLQNEKTFSYGKRNRFLVVFCLIILLLIAMFILDSQVVGYAILAISIVPLYWVINSLSLINRMNRKLSDLFEGEELLRKSHGLDRT